MEYLIKEIINFTREHPYLTLFIIGIPFVFCGYLSQRNAERYDQEKENKPNPLKDKYYLESRAKK